MPTEAQLKAQRVALDKLRAGFNASAAASNDAADAFNSVPAASRLPEVRAIAPAYNAVVAALNKVGPALLAGISAVDAAIAALLPPAPPPSQGSWPAFVAPNPPERFVDLTYPPMTGALHRVVAGGDLQAAINAAQPGDEIVLADGATFVGNYELPVKSGFVVIRAETLPTAPGVRVSPDTLAGRAKVVTPNWSPAFLATNGAKNWRLVGFEITQANGLGGNYGLVVLGIGNEQTVEAQPSNIILDRMYVHGPEGEECKRAVAFNGCYLAVIDSWIVGHGKGYDSQGVCGWAGAGPFHIENNRIEGAGQAVMFGGSDPVIHGLSPSDMVIKRNYLFKPLSWAHGRWTVKATFELKHGRRVLFEGNVLENHWADAQTGYAILFQTLSQDGFDSTWVTVSDIMVRNNIIKNSTGGFVIAGRVAYGGPLPMNPGSRVAVINNLFQDVGIDPISPHQSRVFMLLGDHHNLTILNNTATLKGIANASIIFDGAPAVETIIANNVFTDTEYGIFGSGKGSGNPALDFYLPGAVFSGNVLPGPDYTTHYPAGNFFPASSSEIVFAGADDFSLAPSNPFFSGSFGRIGVDNDKLQAAVAGVSPTVIPSP